MKKSMLLVTMLVLVLATVPAFATSYVYGSCAEIPTQEEAQQILERPTYGIAFNPTPGNPPQDLINLDPDGDGIACNNEGNFAADGDCWYEPDDVTVLYEDGNMPISQNPCGGIVF